MKTKNVIKQAVKMIMIVVLLVINSGCGKSNKVPVINSVTAVEGTVTIDATDDKAVTGYTVVTNAGSPAADDPRWVNTPIIKIEDNGTYNVWVRDADGNVSARSAVTVSIESPLIRLAREYDHLAWVIAPDTEETKALKEKYGDLYPMVEPLTKEQVKERFEYLVKFIVAAEKNNDSLGLKSGLISHSYSDSFLIDTWKFNSDYKEQIFKSTDKNLSKYKNRYYYASVFNEYVREPIKSFTSSETTFGVGLDIIDKVPYEDMEFFIRDYMVEVYKTINEVEKQGLKYHFYFDTKKD